MAYKITLGVVGIECDTAQEALAIARELAGTASLLQPLTRRREHRKAMGVDA